MLSQFGLVLWLMEVEGSWNREFGGALVPLKTMVELFVNPFEIWNCSWHWWFEWETSCILSLFLESFLFLSLLFSLFHSRWELGKLETQLSVSFDALVSFVFVGVDHGFVKWYQYPPWNLASSERSILR